MVARGSELPGSAWHPSWHLPRVPRLAFSGALCPVQISRKPLIYLALRAKDRPKPAKRERILNPRVLGSSPRGGTTPNPCSARDSGRSATQRRAALSLCGTLRGTHRDAIGSPRAAFRDPGPVYGNASTDIRDASTALRDHGHPSTERRLRKWEAQRLSLLAVSGNLLLRYPASRRQARLDPFPPQGVDPCA